MRIENSNPSTDKRLKMKFILDSYAVLAYLQDEEGAQRVKEILYESAAGGSTTYFPLINLGEILYIIERNLGLEEAQKVLGVLRQLPLIILPADEVSVLAAAHIKAQYPISYADAFVISTAQTMHATILTGDPEFDVAADIVAIEQLP
jgi:predicted nucleic acid-binding protein